MSVRDENKTNSKEINEIKTIQQQTERYRPERRRRRSSRSRSGFSKFMKNARRRFSWSAVIVTTLVVVVIFSVTLGVLITDAVADLRDSWQSLDRILATVLTDDGTELTLEDFSRLQESTIEMNERLAVTRQRISILQPIISLQPELRVTTESLAIAQELVTAAENILSGMQPALTFMVSGEEDEAVATRISSGERVVELVELGQGRFVSASANLQAANELLASVELSNVSPSLLLQVEQLRGFQDQLTSINELLISSPDLLTIMLGLDEERSYIVLAQNNDELRPSGGYISTYGWFTVRSARIIDYDYSPTTATSPNPPDESFLVEQGIMLPEWWINYRRPVYAAWDGSWFADFPSTAEMAMDYYNAGNNPQAPVDGVLAIDITGFELMLSALEDVFVPGYNVTVTPQNFRDLVYDIRAFGEGEQPHKEFVAAIYQSIFNEWSEIEQEQTPDLLGAMLEGFQQNHMMFYFADDDLNDAMDTLGWSGRQQTGIGHDYILVADANLGNKSNNSVNQPITYDVMIQPDGSLNSRLTVGYEYFDDIASSDPAIDPLYHGPLNYRSLLQIFLPVGTQINETNDVGNLTVLNQAEHTLLVRNTVIEYDSGERYQLSYTTQPLVQSLGDLNVYRLLVQNQPGSKTQSLNVQVSLPEGATVINSSPTADASYNLEQPIVDYRLELNTDTWIEIIYENPS